MSDNLERLSAAGVAVWLDDLSRDRLQSGHLARLIRDSPVAGVTTNPTIFQKAIAQADGAYDAQLRELAARGVTAEEAVRMITTADVRHAADVLRPVYDATGKRDGRISIEVDPRLAHETAATVAEAKQLWWLVDRPNTLIKVPATRAGIPAIRELIACGISVNVTLIFSIERYRDVMDAYMSGLEEARDRGLDLSGIESVASFFVSRLDTEIDKRLEARGDEEARSLLGRLGLANARLAYEAHEDAFSSARWRALEAAGARRQRPLWTSTSVKNPSYPDTMYVTELVAPGTVNTMPESTLRAVADHGTIAGDTVRGRYRQARADLDAIAQMRIDYDEVVRLLEDEGVAKFEASWLELLDEVGASLARLAGERAAA